MGLRPNSPGLAGNGRAKILFGPPLVRCQGHPNGHLLEGVCTTDKQAGGIPGVREQDVSQKGHSARGYTYTVFNLPNFPTWDASVHYPTCADGAKPVLILQTVVNTRTAEDTCPPPVAN